jgi:dihydroorotase
MPANLALLDLSEEWVVGANGYASRSENSSFHGRTLTGTVKLTVAAGTVAHRALARTAENATGVTA